MNNNYSWLQEALDDNRDNDGERVSELIADTVGGRTRAQIEEQQRQIQQLLDRPNQQQQPQQNEEPQQWQQPQQQQSQYHHQQSYQHQRPLSPQQQQSHQHQRPSSQQQHQRPPSQQRQQTSSNGNNISSRSSATSSINGERISDFARRIGQHPQPGDAAWRLHQMVQQPFSIKFGPSDRGLSSAREIEMHRAGSSTRPPLTPFLKDAEPELFHDSPRTVPVVQSVGTQTQPNSPSVPSHPTHSPSVDYPPPLHNFSTHPLPHTRQSSFVGSPTPPPTPPPDSGTYYYQRQPVASSSPYSTTHHRRAHSLSDYPPLYDFSQRPHIRHSSLSEYFYRNSTLDPNFYRKRFINSLLKDIRKSKDLERKLEGRQQELDAECRQDANELSTIRRERELLVRELEMQSREYEFDERERRRSNSAIAKHSPPRQQPILKHSASFPESGSKSGVTGSSNNNRVNFANPICTSREYTPSNSNSSMRSPSPCPRTRSPSLTSSTVAFRAPVDANKQRQQSQQCVAHEVEFSEQQQRAKATAMVLQRRARAATGRGGMSRNYNSRATVRQNPVNTSSIFQFVKHRPT